MKALALFAALLLCASSALAGRCPTDIKAIDAALPKAKLNEREEQADQHGHHAPDDRRQHELAGDAVVEDEPGLFHPRTQSTPLYDAA